MGRTFKYIISRITKCYKSNLVETYLLHYVDLFKRTSRQTFWAIDVNVILVLFKKVKLNYSLVFELTLLFYKNKITTATNWIGAHEITIITTTTSHVGQIINKQITNKVSRCLGDQGDNVRLKWPPNRLRNELFERTDSRKWIISLFTAVK